MLAASGWCPCDCGEELDPRSDEPCLPSGRLDSDARLEERTFAPFEFGNTNERRME